MTPSVGIDLKVNSAPTWFVGPKLTCDGYARLSTTPDSIQIRIRNSGPEPANAFDVSFGSQTKRVESLAGNAVTTISFAYFEATEAVIVVDVDNEILEVNEDNNVTVALSKIHQEECIPGPTATPTAARATDVDLELYAYAWELTPSDVCNVPLESYIQPNQVSIVIRNNGRQDARAFDVQFDRQIQRIQRLQAGSVAELMFAHNNQTSVQLNIDPENAISEQIKDNNQLTLTAYSVDIKCLFSAPIQAAPSATSETTVTNTVDQTPATATAIPEQLATPTTQVLPTSTFTLTTEPTATPTATDTPVATPTPTDISTATPTPTNTATPLLSAPMITSTLRTEGVTTDNIVVVRGETVSYEVTVTNPNTVALDNLVLQAKLDNALRDAAISPVSHSAVWDAAAQTLTKTIVTLGANETMTFVLSAVVREDAELGNTVALETAVVHNGVSQAAQPAVFTLIPDEIPNTGTNILFAITIVPVLLLATVVFALALAIGLRLDKYFR